MASVNKVILVGNLGADPETRYMPSGDAVTTVRLATTDRYKDKATGEQKEATEWHRVVFFGRLAEVVNEYMKKGSSMYVEGRLRTRKYQAQDGTDRYSTEIVGDSMQMLSGRQDGGERQGAASRSGGADRPQGQRGNPAARGAQQQQQRSQGGGGGYGDGFEDQDIPFGPAYARAGWSAM